MIFVPMVESMKSTFTTLLRKVHSLFLHWESTVHAQSPLSVQSEMNNQYNLLENAWKMKHKISRWENKQFSSTSHDSLIAPAVDESRLTMSAT